MSKELKIYKDFAELFKPLPQKELQELEEKLRKKYDGTPLYTWKDIYIVDGHNRYPILKKYNIDFNTERVEDFLGEDAKKSDIMQWMISNQQARRNMTAGELIFANSMVIDEIRKENEEKMSKGGEIGAAITNNKSGCLQMEAGRSNIERDRSTNTDNQIAKMAGVGTRTVARFNRVMNSDDVSTYL